MAQMTELRGDFAPLINSFGLIQSRPGEDGGNGFLYLCEYLIILARRGLLTEDDIARFRTTLAACSIQPGLLKRSPTGGDQEGPDDYTGLAAAAEVLAHPELAADWLAYGRTNKVSVLGPFKLRYVFNDERPGTILKADGNKNWSAYMGRFPGLVASFQMAAGERPSFWRVIWLALTIFTSGMGNKDQDPRILTWLIIETSRTSFLCRLAGYFWKRRLRRDFPGGMRQVLTNYFGWEHPLAKWWVD